MTKCGDCGKVVVFDVDKNKVSCCQLIVCHECQSICSNCSYVFCKTHKVSHKCKQI